MFVEREDGDFLPVNEFLVFALFWLFVASFVIYSKLLLRVLFQEPEQNPELGSSILCFHGQGNVGVTMQDN